MKKIIKNKKSQTALINSFIYDLLFVIVLAISLFGIIETVDSGMYYWRRFYAEDIGTLFNVIEGVNDDFFMTYVPSQHKTRFPLKNTYLEVDITPGLVQVFSSDNPSYKTSQQFITKDDSHFNLKTILKNFFIVNDNSKLGVTSDSSCISYNIDKKQFAETTIHVKSDVSTLPIKLKEEVEKSLSFKYAILYPPIGITNNLALCLYNKNVVVDNHVPDILFNFKYENSNDNIIIIEYPYNKGNMQLSSTLACKIFNELNNNYYINEIFDNLRVLINHKNSNHDFNQINDKTGAISITFYLTSSSANQELLESLSQSLINSLENILIFEAMEIDCP